MNFNQNVENLFGKPCAEFMNLPTNAAKIKFCQKKANEMKWVHYHGISQEKCELQAIEARNKGNFFFTKEKDFVQALEEYNKSLSFSPTGSENIGICYANRSAVYFQAGYFNLSLENVELALKNNCPHRLTSKLEARREKCIEMMKLERKIESPKWHLPLKLSYPASKLNPFIIDGIEMKTSEKFGRHICAKRDLFPGDFVMIDKPYVKCLEKGLEYRFCNNCHKSNFLNLFPCEFCTKAMYCSTDCQKEAWKRFHKYECKVVEEDLAPIVIRTTFLTFTLFDDLDQLRDLLDSTTKNPVTGFDLDFNNISEAEIFKAIYNLSTNASKRSCMEQFMRSHVIAQTWNLVLKSPNIKDLLKSSANEDLFLELMFHFSQISATNSHELLYTSKSEDETQRYLPQKVGSAIFPVISLINHSCAANVMRIDSDGQIALMVLRNIKKGEQLFDNYGAHHQMQTKTERQEELKSYLFECDCEACENDYPMFMKCQIKGLVELSEILDNYRKGKDYDPKWALHYIEKFKTFLKNFSQHYPCFEVMAAEVSFITCTTILFGNVPLELQLKSSDQ